MQSLSLWQRMLQRPMVTSSIALLIGALAAITIPSSYAREAKKLAQYTGSPSSQGMPPPSMNQPPGGTGYQPPPSGSQPPPGAGEPRSGGIYPQPGMPQRFEGAPQPGQGQYPEPGKYSAPNMFKPMPESKGHPGGPEFAPSSPGQKAGEGEKRQEEFMKRQQQDNERRQQEEDKRQGEMDERRKEMEAKSLEQMKRGLGQMEKHLARSRQFFEKHAAKGVKIPSECTEALTTLQKLLETLKAATSFESIQDAGMEDMQEHFQTLNECRMQVEQLARIPQILKQVDRAIERITRQWVRAKQRAPAEASSVVSEGDAIVQSIKDARAKLDLSVIDLEEIQSTLDEGIFSRFDDLGSVMQRLEAARNARKFLSFVPRMIRNMEKSIAAAKKAGNDISQLTSIVNDIKAQFEFVKTLKPGSEEFQDAIDAIAELGQSFAEAAGTQEGESSGRYFGPPAGGASRGQPGFGGSQGFDAGQFMKQFPGQSSRGPNQEFGDSQGF